MLVNINGSAVVGIDAICIGIEVNVSAGTNYYIVGLPDNSIKESLQRVESAIKQSGFKMPRTKIVINLFPAAIKKSGAAFDLPIAIGILQASEQIQVHPRFTKAVIMGELGLDGTVRSIIGALPMTLQAKKDEFEHIILPQVNTQEAAIVPDISVYGVNHLQEVVNLLEQGNQSPVPPPNVQEIEQSSLRSQLDFSDVKGQENVKRALEIAAAGGHNVIMIGPPGVGKTMLSKRMPSILPPMSFDEVIEVTKIYSVHRMGNIDPSRLMVERPFRSPHHTISDIALVGGGSDPMPGEVSLAHRGVLFLDELPEFKRSVLEVLRQPLEEKHIYISRAKMTVKFPANFMLIAAMNPCPCGYYNHPEKQCVCPPGVVKKYMQRISGPLMDRIDLHVEVSPIPIHQMMTHQTTTHSETIRERILKARGFQTERYKSEQATHTNADLSSKQIKTFCALDATSANLLKKAVQQLDLSARAHNGILKVARTIADLALSPNIQVEHVAESIQFRCLDRGKWGA